MDSRFFLIPVAALTIVQPAQATTYLSIQQAQALMFPGATLTENFRTLSDAQVAIIEKTSGANVGNKQLRAWSLRPAVGSSQIRSSASMISFRSWSRWTTKAPSWT